MSKKNGFTLVELLATIIILGIIISIVGYVAINAINKSKDKSYKVTINEIEKDASNYLMENSNRLFFLTNNDKGYEYQCVMVENLVDYGYLSNNIIKSNVSKDDTVSLDDYIYIERNKNTKSIEKVLYTKTKPEYASICGKAVNALGDIIFSSNPGFDEWSKYKDITITYKLKNLNDERTIGNYIFNHKYDGTNEYNSENDKLENNIKTKIVRVMSNGEMNADIKLKDEIIVNSSIGIDKIDILGPIVSLDDFSEKKVHGQVLLPLKVTDEGSGVNHSSFTKDDIVVKVNEIIIDDIELEYKSEDNYNLTINNNKIDGNIKIYIEKDKIFDKLENGNNDIEIDTGISFENIYRITYDANGGSNAPSATTYTYSTTEKVNLSNDKPIRESYIFLGWSENRNASSASYGIGGAYPRNNTSDITLYAIWEYGVWPYGFTGGIQSLTIPTSGYYKLEVWGAEGGRDGNRSVGGKGGYSVGEKWLDAGNIIYIVVGGAGESSKTNAKGGYNGGGKAGKHNSSGGGGGATHIATMSGVLSSLSNNKDKVLIVAGGGGGGGYSCNRNGGAGGGENGENSDGGGGTQWSGGSGSPRGSFGQGGNRPSDDMSDGGGGGGGYYGGGGSDCRSNYPYRDGGGGGGSGYIGGVINGSMQSGIQPGNGYAKVTYLR